jgi:hypothetical protein
VTDAELDAQLMLLESPLGGEPDVRERERAAAWLLAHPDAAHPALLALVADGRAGPAAIELLGRFGDPASVAPLAALVDTAEPTGRAAAQALASHPAPAALDALSAALAAGGDGAPRAADALAVRGDVGACPALRTAVGSADAVLRYHALQAAGALGCLPPDEELAALADADADADVRELARSLIR